jgi:hypothetical protein
MLFDESIHAVLTSHNKVQLRNDKYVSMGSSILGVNREIRRRSMHVLPLWLIVRCIVLSVFPVLPSVMFHPASNITVEKSDTMGLVYDPPPERDCPGHSSVGGILEFY